MKRWSDIRRLPAMTCRHSRTASPTSGEAAAVHAAIRKLHDDALTAAEWIALARDLTRPLAAHPLDFPVPELVSFLCPAGSDPAVAASLWEMPTVAAVVIA